MFTVLCRHAQSDRQSTEAFLYVIGHLTLKQNTIFFYIHIIVISTGNNKGANSYKLKVLE